MKPLHVVNVWANHVNFCLGQIGMSEKSNEIPAVQELLEILNLKGAVVTADAMHCQKKTAKKIIDCAADYVLPVKNNLPTLMNTIAQILPNMKRRVSWRRAFVAARQANAIALARKLEPALCVRFRPRYESSEPALKLLGEWTAREFSAMATCKPKRRTSSAACRRWCDVTHAIFANTGASKIHFITRWMSLLQKTAVAFAKATGRKSFLSFDGSRCRF